MLLRTLSIPLKGKILTISAGVWKGESLFPIKIALLNILFPSLSNPQVKADGIFHEYHLSVIPLLRRAGMSSNSHPSSTCEQEARNSLESVWLIFWESYVYCVHRHQMYLASGTSWMGQLLALLSSCTSVANLAQSQAAELSCNSLHPFPWSHLQSGCTGHLPKTHAYFQKIEQFLSLIPASVNF